jgi:hypothetical protein
MFSAAIPGQGGDFHVWPDLAGVQSVLGMAQCLGKPTAMSLNCHCRKIIRDLAKGVQGLTTTETAGSDRGHVARRHPTMTEYRADPASSFRTPPPPITKRCTPLLRGPVGSFEQHDPYLALVTDSLIVTIITDALGRSPSGLSQHSQWSLARSLHLLPNKVLTYRGGLPRRQLL